jgi:hypothetical protein
LQIAPAPANNNYIKSSSGERNAYNRYHQNGEIRWQRVKGKNGKITWEQRVVGGPDKKSFSLNSANALKKLPL